jgi:hypothetical protein
MKKLTIFVMVALFAVMFSAPAFSEDRLSLSGGYFARGWHVDDGTFDQDYFYQRMRVQAKIAVADDVTAVIRADMSEGTWGLNYATGSVARPGAQAGGSFRNAIDFDRAYVSINKEMWSLTAGQQYVGLGICEVMDAQLTALNFGLKFAPVNLNLIYAKQNESLATTDEDTLGTEDIDIYAANAGFKVGGFDSNIFFAMVNDDTAAEAEPWGLGLNTSATLGMVNLVGELAFFGGDNAAGIDYKGLQFYAKGDSNVNDMVNVGAELLYAKGYDSAGDAQITSLTNWDTFTPMGNNTPMDGWISGLNWNPFDPSNSGAGVMGLTLFFKATPMEKLALGGKVGYFQTEDDDVVDGDVMTFNAWVAYEIASNTKVSLTYLHSDSDVDSIGNVATTVDPDAEKTLVLELAVSF